MREMKRKNGSGSVYKLKGKRRKPSVAAVTTNWNGEKQKRKLLGSYVSLTL